MRRRAFLATGIGAGLAGCAGREPFGIGSGGTESGSHDDGGEPTATDETHRAETDHELIVYDPYLDVDWEAITHHKSSFHGHPRNQLPNPAQIADFYRGLQKGARGRTVAEDDPYTVYSVTGKGGDPMLYPWTEFSKIDSNWANRDPEELGVVAFPASEAEATEHVVSPFSLIMDDYINADDRHGVIEEIITREEFHEPKGLAILVHPDRYVEGPDEWERYKKDLDAFSREDGFVGTDIFSRTDPTGDTLRPMWDNILTAYAPERMFWGFSADDASNYRVATDADVRWTTLLLEDGEFDPADQEGSRQAAMEAFLEGRTLATARRPAWDEAELEAYPTTVPRIHSIEIDERGITLNADNYTEVRWISGGEVVTTGPSLVLSPDHAPYVRAELEIVDGHNHSITCTQPWGVAPTDE